MLTTSMHWPCCLCCHFLWLYVIIWSWRESVQVFFIVCLYMHCRWRSTYQETRVRIPLPGIAPPHVCVCTKARPGFPTTVLFVNNGGIDEYQRLKFLFIIQWEKEWTRNNLNEYFKKITIENMKWKLI